MRPRNPLKIQESRVLYEYPLPYCNSGNRYCFMVCSIVLSWRFSYSHLSWGQKKGLPNTEVSDSPNWLLQDAESPCRHDLISRLTWITFGVPSLHFLISAQSPRSSTSAIVARTWDAI